MKFKIGDKVDIINEQSYHINGSIEPFVRHGNVSKNRDKYELRGAKVIDKVDKFYIVRFLDDENNYVDLGYLEDNLEKFEDCEPNVVSVSNFGDLLSSLSNDYGNVDMYGCEELLFDNFHLNYFIGKWGEDILIIKTSDGIFHRKSVINAFIVKEGRKIRIISRIYYNDLVHKLSEFELNHRPLILKKLK